MSYYSTIDEDIETIKDIVAIVKIVKIVQIVQGYTKSVSKEKRKTRRREWVARREQRRVGPTVGPMSIFHGEAVTEDLNTYRNYLQMDESTFTRLLSLINHRIAKRDTNMRQCISSRDKLSVTLRFLATGESYNSLSQSTTIAACTISLFVPQVCRAIYCALEDEYLKMPNTEDEWLKVAEGFTRLQNCPNCLGALDAKHIAFRPPKSAGSIYLNYKRFNSIIFLALVDANYKFLYVDVGTNGRASSDDLYRYCHLSEALQTNTIHIPPPRPLPHRETSVPFVMVADDTFPLSEHIMTPYPNSASSVDQRIHNYRLSQVQRVSENAFGVFANRFKIFMSTMTLAPEKVQSITFAACALHNFLLSAPTSNYMPAEYIDRELANGTVVPGDWRSESFTLTSMIADPNEYEVGRELLAVQDEYKAYFNEEGAVPWQNDHIENTQLLPFETDPLLMV